MCLILGHKLLWTAERQGSPVVNELDVMQTLKKGTKYITAHPEQLPRQRGLQLLLWGTSFYSPSL